MKGQEGRTEQELINPLQCSTDGSQCNWSSSYRKGEGKTEVGTIQKPQAYSENKELQKNFLCAKQLHQRGIFITNSFR